MKRILAAIALALALGTAGLQVPAQTAATRVASVETRIFAVKNMSCALCPLTVKRAMQRVPGVRSVAIDFPARTATVAFDPSVTDAGAISAASTDAGYPAAPIGSGARHE